MAKRLYNFEYGTMTDASCSFLVDLDKFTKETAQMFLDFYSWDTPYDKDEDPIDEAMKKLAMKAIFIATSHGGCSERKVMDEFKEMEAFAIGTPENGITLTNIEAFNFDESELEMSKVENDKIRY